MKLEVLPPYSSEFDNAYLVSSQGRNTVCLYNTITKTRRSVSYARYLMSTSLRRILLKTEQVDHINNIRNDDRIENLQILTPEENFKKYKATCKKQWVTYKCPICSKVFDRQRRQSHFTIKTKISMTCSRKCGGKVGHLREGNKIIVLNEYSK